MDEGHLAVVDLALREGRDRRRAVGAGGPMAAPAAVGAAAAAEGELNAVARRVDVGRRQ